MMEMITEEKAKIYYKALLEKNAEYEGIFFVNLLVLQESLNLRIVNFYTAQQALLASYRPCKRCNPLYPEQAFKIVKILVAAVNANHEKR